jgi:ABC-type uncharacterized transport system substrate-binding protein
LSAKRLEILRALVPGISRFAILWDSSNPGMAQRVRETEIAADKSHVSLHTVGPRTVEELDAAFAELLERRPDALLVTTRLSPDSIAPVSSTLPNETKFRRCSRTAPMSKRAA